MFLAVFVSLALNVVDKPIARRTLHTQVHELSIHSQQLDWNSSYRAPDDTNSESYPEEALYMANYTVNRGDLARQRAAGHVTRGRQLTTSRNECVCRNLPDAVIGRTTTAE